MVEQCTSGISFKNSESSSWQFLDADSYQLETRGGQCFVGYEVSFTVTLREYLVDCDRDNNNNCVTPRFIRGYADKTVSGTITTPDDRRIDTPLFHQNPVYPEVMNSDGSITTLADWQGSRVIALVLNGGVTRTRSTSFYISSPSQAGYYEVSPGSFKRYNARLFLNNSVITTEYRPLKPEPLDCIRNCTFTAYKNGQQVYIQQGSTCPLVQCAGQCPPNTCSVDCGSYVCCYGSDGISVFNYNK
ncbi:hypothetical protein C7B62_24860 [Pleurocapsa sp. CCALA 161]|uniref:hypothetical protein n=1 Tax=Pleurocapsa sp. CCALA 161 TaxID=2107688 RepID=UPI000D07852A|nr:hypothetical protein [Pleurocapsa sp. CCALA 161]PSB05603.1 hypothetical protein C7B62_24860 [Pleurocapsa sp. CCALA 161]